ncbi:DUF4012 domain-containing protein [Nocardioides bizhenqiangii]|uniref:DUF4012 domain-containing protein n=1 Tax=Nocardioides bizhenqiangii TaxID=3095076 RepID=A0ABZ0ZQD7_9ACTN|nr:DUF4012 domain-containing protein [Nocardioides sp. HM61]WQQ25979.1 DUF4012 domain-containing protein [Nocardioides sp. HM61]
MSPVVRRRRRRRNWRDPRAWARDHPVRAVLLGLVGVAVLWALWAGWTAWTAAQDLKDVERSALLLRQELEDGDAAGAERALARYQDAASSAHDRTHGPTWWALERLPVLGNDAAAVATAATVLEDLGETGIPELVDAAALVTARSFNPTNHRFPLGTIESVGETARSSERAFDKAANTLEGIDTDELEGPVGTRFQELRRIVVSARSTLGSAYRAAELMPSLLGADGERELLLVFQNNAELRSLGGLAGSMSLISADRGEVHIVRQEGTSKYGAVDRPPVPLTRGEDDVFGPTLGQWLINATMSPDVPRASVLAGTRWQDEVGGGVDAVFFVDPVAVSYLLTATGPVAVPGYGTVSSADVVAKVENLIYLDEPDRDAQEDFQNAVAKAVFNAFADGRGDPVEVIRTLATGVSEGRVRMHSFVEEEQQEITGTEIAGELVTGDDSRIGVYVNDALESKMTYYLDHRVNAVTRSCTGYHQQVAGSIHLANTASDDLDLPPTVSGIVPEARFYEVVEPGQQRVAIFVIGPRGGSIDELSLDQRPFQPIATQEYAGRPVAQVVTVIDPGTTQEIEFVMSTGDGQTGPVELDVTPGAFPGSSATRLQSAC